MKKIFSLTNKYIILATPLILFSLISGIYLTVSAAGKVINLLIAIILFTFMLAAFIAGWFNMIKFAVKDGYDDDPNALIKEFTPGVGEYFLPALGSILVIIAVSLIIMFASYYGEGYWTNEDYADEDGRTLEESVKDAVMEEIETDLLLEQHMSEYGVEITEEEQAAMDEAAAKFMEDNSDEAVKALGATEEYVADLLYYETVSRKMTEAIGATADSNISEEE